MIGQDNLLKTIDCIIDRYPRFTIITGSKGSGKKTICKEITKKLGMDMILSSTKIDDIRSTIDIAYTQTNPIAYLIADADDMSIGAKNCLLKVTEEPPKNAFFFMTLRSPDNTLETIRSRGTTFTLDPYSKEDLERYRKYRGYNAKYDTIIKEICSNTGEVDEIFSYDVEKFYKSANNIAANINVPKNGNAFKISSLVKVKEDDKGYDLYLLLNTVRQIYLNKAKTSRKREYIDACIVTSKYMQELRSTVINKISLTDMWIMDIRKVLGNLDWNSQN